MLLLLAALACSAPTAPPEPQPAAEPAPAAPAPEPPAVAEPAPAPEPAAAPEAPTAVLAASPEDERVAAVLAERLDIAVRCRDVIDDKIPDIHGTATLAILVEAGEARALVLSDDSKDGHLGHCTAGRIRELAFPADVSGRFEAAWTWPEMP